MSRALRPLLLLALLLLALPPGPARAQAGVEPVVVHLVTEALDDRLRVTVFFALRDGRGRPVLRDGPNGVALDELGAIKLLSPIGPDAPARVGDPETPLNLLLLIDTSGSMARRVVTSNGEQRMILDDVKAAAVAALEAAPGGTNFALARFDDLPFDRPLNLAQPLTAELGQIAGSISAIPSPAPRAPTCMFNASYQGVEYLRQNALRPEERRAVLLFTDGNDETSGGAPCSTRQTDNVVGHAQANRTAIYTIGLCDDSSCANIDRFALRELADETAAIALTGTREEMADRFGLVMEELRSQWAIQADLYPRRGLNTGLIQVTAGGRLFSQEFTFESPDDYNPPPSFELLPAYDAASDRFLLQVDLANAENLESATLEVWDSEGGTRLRSQPIDRPGQVEVATDGMFAEREYLFRIRAVAKGGQPLLGPENSPYAVERAVLYEPRLDFAIDAAAADWENRRLLIDVRVRGAGGSQPIFDGQVTNERGEELIPINRAALNDAGRIELPLPEALRQARGEQKLKARLILAAEAAPVEQELEFTVVPPGQPFPWVMLLLGLIVLTLGIYGLIRLTRRPVAAGAVLAPLPQAIPHSNPSGELRVAPGTPRLRVRVVRSPDLSEVRAEVITSFPCVIGAGTGAGFLVRGATTVSRTHLQITHHPQTGFEITDISRHGTFIVSGTRLDRLKPKVPIALRGPVQVSLASEIMIDLEPL